MNLFSLIPSKGPRRIIPLLSILLIVLGFISFLALRPTNQIQNGMGICRGFGMQQIDNIPTAVIRAASLYLKTDMAVGVIANATPVDPIRESSAPHRCLGVRDDLNPNGPGEGPAVQVLSDKNQIEALAARQRRYSGVIPAGATKAMRISVLHSAPRPTYKGKDPIVLQFLDASSAYVSSDLIIAYYPKRGWVGVFKFPEQGGFPAYP